MGKPEFNADNEIVYKVKAESDVSELKETLKLVKKIKKAAKKANHLLDELATKRN